MVCDVKFNQVRAIFSHTSGANGTADDHSKLHSNCAEKSIDAQAAVPTLRLARNLDVRTSDARMSHLPLAPEVKLHYRQNLDDSGRHVVTLRVLLAIDPGSCTLSFYIHTDIQLQRVPPISSVWTRSCLLRPVSFLSIYPWSESRMSKKNMSPLNFLKLVPPPQLFL